MKNTLCMLCMLISILAINTSSATPYAKDNNSTPNHSEKINYKKTITHFSDPGHNPPPSRTNKNSVLPVKSNSHSPAKTLNAANNNPPVNDDSLHPFTLRIANEAEFYNNFGATIQNDEPNQNFSNGISNTVWFTFRDPTCEDIQVIASNYFETDDDVNIEIAVYAVDSYFSLFSEYTQIGYAQKEGANTTLSLNNLDPSKNYLIQVQTSRETTFNLDITAPDIPPMVITQNITVALDETGEVLISPLQIDAGSSSNCTINSRLLDISRFDCSNIGENIVTLTVDNIYGTSAYATAVVTVVDNIAPEAYARTSNYVAVLDSNGTLSVNPESLDNGSRDNCGIASFSLSKSSFDCSDIGENAVTLTVTDFGGNSDTTSAIIQIFDADEPIVRTRNISVVLDENNQANITANDINDGSSDNCSIQSMEIDIANFDCSNLGDNTVTLTVTDFSNYTASSTAIVTVLDQEPPIARAKNVTLPLNTNGQVILSPEIVNDNSSDNCTIVSYDLDISILDCSDIGTNSVTLSVTDNSNNTSTDTAVVTVIDNLPPIVNTKNITVFLDDNGQATVTPLQVDNNSFDNCGIQNISLNLENFDCTNIGSNEVTLTVSDINNNTASKTATVTVRDTQAPIVNTNNISVILDENAQANITTDDIVVSASDNCGIASMALSQSEFDCSTLGDNTVTLTVTDSNGNQSTSSAIVTVLDQVLPVVITKNINIGLNVNGQATISSLDIDDGSSDNCGIESMVLDTTSFNCANLGENTVTLTVTDTGGNSVSATAIVTINNNNNPYACCLFTIPFAENFDATSASNSSNPNSPECWSYIADGSGWAYVSNNTNNADDQNHYELYNSDDVTGNYMLISPNVEELSVTGANISFRLKTDEGASVQVGTMTDPTDASSFILAETVTYSNSGLNSYVTYTVTIPQGNNQYFALRHANAYPFYKIFLDNIQVKAACAAPINRQVADVTRTTAHISWDATPTSLNGYEWRLMEEHNTVPFTEALIAAQGSVNAGTTNLELSNLSPNTKYTFYIRSLCDGDTSVFSEPLKFHTNLNLPFFEGFETTEEGSLSNSNAPELWGFIKTSSTGAAYVSESIFSNTGYKTYVIYNGSDTNADVMLVSPKIEELTTTGIQITLSAGGPRNDFFEVGTLSNPEDPTSFSVVSNLIFNAPPEEYYKDFTINIPATTDTYVAIRHGQRNSQTYYYLDDINVQILPCLVPENVQVSHVTDTSATINWQATANLTNSYQWLVMPNGQSPNIENALLSGTLNLGETTANISGLNGNTTYDIYVLADCEDAVSDWSAVQTFNTPCAFDSLPYLEDFSSGIINECWTISNTNEISIASYCGTNQSNFLKINGGFNEIVTNNINIANETEVQVSFQIFNGCTDTAEAGQILEISYWNGTEWVLFDEIDTESIAAVWSLRQYTFSEGLSENFKLKFTRYFVGNTGQDDISIDNLSVNVVPDCLSPQEVTLVNLTDNSAEISWTQVSNALNGYQWIIMPADQLPNIDNAVTSGTIDSGTAQASASGLTASTPYKAYLRSLCGPASESTWSNGLYFVTLAIAPSNDKACDAIALPLGNSSAGNAYTTIGATAQDGEPEENLDGGIDGSVWFTFVAPSTGAVQISTDILGGTLTDTEVAVYSVANCEDFTTFVQVGFDQDSGILVEFNNFFNQYNLTPGETYYIQVDSWEGETPGNFGIEIKEILATYDQIPPNIILQNITLELDDNGIATFNPSDLDAGSTDDTNTELSFSTLPTKQIYAFGFEDWYDNIQTPNDYPSLHRYTFNNNTNNLSEPQLMFFIDEFEDQITDGYYPIAYDRNPLTGIDYFIIGDGPRALFTYDTQTYEANFTGIEFSENISDFTFDMNGLAYAWIGNTIFTVDLVEGTKTALVDVTQGGGAKGLTYDYNNHRLLLGSGGNSADPNEQGHVLLYLGEIDLNTNVYNLLGTMVAQASTNEPGNHTTIQAIEYVGNNKCLVSGGWWNYDFGILDLETLTIDYSNQINISVNPEQPAYKDIFVPIDLDIFAEETNQFSCENIGDNEITIYVKDTSGNQVSATATITVIDALAPVADLESLEPLVASCGLETLTAPTATDACDGTITATTDMLLPITESTTITWIYTDSSGNSSQQTQELVVSDTGAPVANTAVLEDIIAQCDITTLVPPTATDACDGTITANTDMLLPITENTTITWIYTDSSGNSSQQTQELVVSDTEAPQISALNTFILNLVDGQATITADMIDTGSTDNCAIASRTFNRELFNCEDLTAVQPIVLTYTVTDTSGNSSTAHIEVTLADSTNFCPTLAVVSPLKPDHWVLYPNPAANLVYLRTQQDVEFTSIKIIDSAGRVLKTFFGSEAFNGMYVGDLPTAHYLLELTTNTNQKVVKNLMVKN